MRVVVHGTGSIGMRHLRVLRSLSVETLALPVREQRVHAPELRGHRVVGSYAEARALGARAAIIATDTIRHLSDATEALEAGLGVLVEKPVAPAVHGVADLALVAARCGRPVFVAQNMRFHRSLLEARSALPRLGALRSVRIECQSYLPDWRPDRDFRESYSARVADGGVLRDLVHDIDYGCWLFGRPERVLAATRTGLLGIQAEEEADMLWLAAGASVSVRLDYITRISRRRFQVDGENGNLEWDGLANVVTLRCVGVPSEVSHHPMDRDEMMADQSTAFLGALEGRGAGHLATLDEGGFAVAVADAARRSAATGTRATVAHWRTSSA